MKIYVAKTDKGYIESWTENYELAEPKLEITETEDITKACLLTENKISSLVSTMLEWELGLDFFELVDITSQSRNQNK